VASIKISIGELAEAEAAELSAAAAALPEPWSIAITAVGADGEFRVSLDGGEDGTWNTTFFPSQVPLAVSWLRGFMPRRRHTDIDPA